MKNLVWLAAFTASLSISGCAALQDAANTIFGNSSQKITRTPIWVYKPDIMLGIGGKNFSGAAVTVLGPTDIQVWSAVDIDRVQVDTCSRTHICQLKGGALACDVKTSANPGGVFEVESSFFGNPQKYMIYHFVPDKIENNSALCPSMHMTISIYDKNALAAWGFVGFRTNPEKNFPATFTCDATDWHFQGASVCSAKAGTLQEINFDTPVDNYRAEDTCNLKKISDTEFVFQPAVGWCRASFGRELKYHDVILNGFDEVLIRDGSE